MSSITDGHGPTIGSDGLIACECGDKPKKRAARASMQHVWHMSHRRRLGLRPVEYVWPGAMSGPSTGGYVRVRGYHWQNGQWERNLR